MRPRSRPTLPATSSPATALAIAVMVLVPVGPLTAQDRVVNPHVVISLVPASTIATPGQWLPAALVLEVEPGWHIYWRNPGESGIATSAVWKLPSGWRVDSLTWPVPERYDVAGITSHVHRGTVAFGTRFAVPPGASGDADIGVQLSYGICREQCLPGKAWLDLVLPAGETTAPSADWNQVQAIMRARAPRQGGPAVTVRVQDSILFVTLRGRNGGSLAPGTWTFFPADRVVGHAAVTAQARPGARQLVLRVPLAECTPIKLNGVLVKGDPRSISPRGYAVSVPVSRHPTC